MRIGLDFGTTNSGAAVYDGRGVRLFGLDPTGRDPAVIPSTLYITRDHLPSIGKEAVDAYYEQNIGRPSKLVRQRVGELEIATGSVGTVKGYPINIDKYVQTVYALVDELTPGRLLRSLKSGLATPYEGTTIFGRYYELEELIASYLGEIRRRVERVSGEPADGVVLGRPVHFVDSQSDADDARAIVRLRRAAELAGFAQVDFELEPLAAALHYELTVPAAQNVLVFDLGGGTLDVTVMRVGDPAGRRVYANGGVGIAGDTFDRQLIAGMLLDHFGRNSTWGPDQAPFPGRYCDALLNLHALAELNKPETIRFLRWAHPSSSNPRALRAFESLLVNNYGARLYDEVERVKIALSSKRFDSLQLKGDNIDLWQPVTRSQFEGLIAGELAAAERCLSDTLQSAGLPAERIDAVVLSGGSAQVPAFVALMERLFDPGRVVQGDVFSGVTAGLAICAAQEA